MMEIVDHDEIMTFSCYLIAVKQQVSNLISPGTNCMAHLGVLASAFALENEAVCCG